MFTTYALYYVNMLGLNPFQLALVGTALEVTIVLLEIPTGLVADLYGRRLSVVIGTLVLGAAYLLEGSIPFLGGLLPFFVGRGRGGNHPGSWRNVPERRQGGVDYR